MWVFRQCTVKQSADLSRTAVVVVVLVLVVDSTRTLIYSHPQSCIALLTWPLNSSMDGRATSTLTCAFVSGCINLKLFRNWQKWEKRNVEDLPTCLSFFPFPAFVQGEMSGSCWDFVVFLQTSTSARCGERVTRCAKMAWERTLVHATPATLSREREPAKSAQVGDMPLAHLVDILVLVCFTIFGRLWEIVFMISRFRECVHVAEWLFVECASWWRFRAKSDFCFRQGLWLPLHQNEGLLGRRREQQGFDVILYSSNSKSFVPVPLRSETGTLHRPGCCCYRFTKPISTLETTDERFQRQESTVRLRSPSTGLVY